MTGRRNCPKHRTAPRQGLITPAVVLALLVVLSAAALALDRLWLQSASVEATGVAEASVLAACRALADDDLLKDDADPQRRIGRARRQAAAIAIVNRTAGRPVQLADDDVRFGRRVMNTRTGAVNFLETGAAPTSVVVRVQLSRSQNNPVARLFGSAVGYPEADVVEVAQATIDNRVIGVRPYGDVPVPALPLAILKSDPSGIRPDTWDLQIGQRQGPDRFGYDAERDMVIEEPDGIPEIVLESAPLRGEADEANVVLADLGTGLRGDGLSRQFENGWSADDLARLGGELRFDGRPLEVSSTATIRGTLRTGLAGAIGQVRICLLYGSHQAVGKFGLGRVTLDAMVAGRILSLELTGRDSVRMVFQPAVITTRTAILADPGAASNVRTADRNRYVYKLHRSG